MDSFTNDARGMSLVLRAGDSLKDVPASHRDIVTTDIKRAFRDPVRHFRKLASECKIPAMADWLGMVSAEGNWSLVLEEGFMMSNRLTAGTFFWRSTTRTSAYVSLATGEEAFHSEPAFLHYYSLVDVVRWEPLGFSGGLLGCKEHISLKAYGAKCRSRDFLADRTGVWGTTDCGDLLIYTRSGDAGFLSHENGQAYSLGSIEDAIAYVFTELLAARTPAFDFAKVRKR